MYCERLKTRWRELKPNTETSSLVPVSQRRWLGLWGAVVWGCSVTFILQNLRSFERVAFDRWYAPWLLQMKQRTEFKYLDNLRTQLQKEGIEPAIGTGLHIEHLAMDDLKPVTKDPPPFAESFFVGDRLGGSGWNIVYPDGSTDQFYVALPTSVRMTSEIVFAEPTSAGNAPPPMPIPVLIAAWIDFLETMVRSARHIQR